MVSILTTQTKYIALEYASRGTIWILWFINKLRLDTIRDLTLFGNNEMNIALTKNAEIQYYIKHIDI